MQEISMTALEDLVNIEPGTPIVLASEHGWLQAAGFLVKLSKRHVTLEMERGGKRRGKNKSPRKRYRLSDFVTYEALELNQEETREPRRKDIVLFTTEEGAKGCGYINKIEDNTIEFQMASPDNIRTIRFAPGWLWMRIGCDRPSKQYTSIKQHTILKRWKWFQFYNPHSKPIN